jgi:hypothetical protein
MLIEADIKSFRLWFNWKGRLPRRPDYDSNQMRAGMPVA